MGKSYNQLSIEERTLIQTQLSIGNETGGDRGGVAAFGINAVP